MSAHDPSSAELMRLLAESPWDPLALDEDTAERLLAGDLDASEAPPGFAEVAAIMAAAAAAPCPDELAGEAAAVTRLLAARAHRPASRRRRGAQAGGRRRTGLAVAIVLSALSTGGVAAAATGHVPEPIREAARSLLTTIGVATPGTPAGPGRQPVPSSEEPGTGTTSHHRHGAPRTRAAHHRPPLPDPRAARAAVRAGQRAAVSDRLGQAAQADRAGDARRDDGRGCGADSIAAYCGTAPPRNNHPVHGQGGPDRKQHGGPEGTQHSQGRGDDAARPAAARARPDSVPGLPSRFSADSPPGLVLTRENDAVSDVARIGRGPRP